MRVVFSFQYLAHEESGLVRRRQPCFPSIARLKDCMLRKPMPPFTLGTSSLSHESQCSERLSNELPHQYLAMHEVIDLQTFFVKRKQLMLKVGIDWTTVLRRTSLAAQAMFRSDQPRILSRHLSTMCSKVPLVIFLIAVGRPR